MIALALSLACAAPSARPMAPSPGPMAPSTPPVLSVDPPLTPLDSPPPAPAEAPTPPVPSPGSTPVSAQQLYDACRARVEEPQVVGECASDADCASTGCSQEMCVAAKAADGLLATCEILPCFATLDTCGCHAGVCSWTLHAPPSPPLRHLP